MPNMPLKGKTDFMSVNWKAVAIASSGAFLLSFLTGLIAGVTFDALLWRAVFFGVLFGVGTVASSYSMQRWLPELLSQDAGAGTGRHVDMTVGDDEEEQDEPSEASASNASRGGLSSVFDDSMIEEVEETSAADTEPSEQKAGQQKPASGGTGSGGSAIEADDDSLPELDGFSDSFETVGTDADSAVSSEWSSSHAAEEHGMDTKSMAEALRTVLKRDE
ncbi:MAG: hypothetical protein ACLFNQ_05495 [Spirochaetaceae bacterium]